MAARPPEETVDQARALYEQGVSLNKIHDQTGIAKTTLVRRAKAEGWVSPKPPRKPAHVIEAEIEDATAARVVGSAGSDDYEVGIDVLADRRARVIEGHQAEWRKVDGLRAKAMAIAAMVKVVESDLSDREKRSEASAKISIAQKIMRLYGDAVAATKDKQEAERRAHGFDYKQQLEERRNAKDSTEDITEFMRLLDEAAHKLAAPTPNVPRRKNGETIQ